MLQRALKRQTANSINDDGDDGPTTSKKSCTRSSIGTKKDIEDKLCFFCDEPLKSDDKYRRVASTFDLDSCVRKCATDLGDSKLLTKFATGDMVAIEAEYHATCLSTLYYRHSKLAETKESQCSNRDILGIVFAELTSCIIESRYKENPNFKMSELKDLYTKRLNQLFVHDEVVHTTRLKNFSVTNP